MDRSTLVLNCVLCACSAIMSFHVGYRSGFKDATVRAVAILLGLSQKEAEKEQEEHNEN